jgi:hypothetical protein
MTPTQAGALMRRARKLLRTGIITAKQFALLDCLVFSCRPTGADRCAVSFTRLAKLAHMARDTVRLGLASLERSGLLSRVKRRVRVVWGLGVASRQATNIYVLSTEAEERPVYREQGDSHLYDRAAWQEGSALQVALVRLETRLRSSWGRVA